MNDNWIPAFRFRENTFWLNWLQRWIDLMLEAIQIGDEQAAYHAGSMAALVANLYLQNLSLGIKPIWQRQ